MGTVASHFVQSSWAQEELFVAEKIFPFMEADSWPTSRPISTKCTNPANISLVLDTINYGKGTGLIRMMSMFLGVDVFQRGIQSYLKTYSYSSATQQDLWRCFSLAANNTINVEQIMNGWTRQAGYPIVEVNRVYMKADGKRQIEKAESELVITQQPFRPVSSEDKQNIWFIPFKYFDQTPLSVCKFVFVSLSSSDFSVASFNSEP
jgi:aminopeptidase N